MSQGPHSRKRHDSGKTGEVHKREEGLNTGPVGNSRKESSSTNKAPIRGITRGGPLSLLAILALLVFGGGNILGGGNTQTPVSQPQTPAPTQQTTQTPSSPATGYHFGTQTTNNVTYTNATTPQADTTVASGSRDKYTKLLGDGKDQVTVMVYMCGTDLETNYGMGTSDLNEMAYAAHSDKVNIIVQHQSDLACFRPFPAETGRQPRTQADDRCRDTGGIHSVLFQELSG